MADQNNFWETQIIGSFSKYAKTYDRYAHLQKTMAERLAVLLPNPVPETVLEIGCGTGVFTRHLLIKPFKTIMLNDIAVTMVDQLRHHNRVSNCTRIMIGNAEKIKLPRVNLIVANAVFQWFEDPGMTLKHFFSALKPTGGLIFSTLGPKTLQEFRKTARIKSPINLLSFSRWKRLIQEAGYKIVEAESETRKTFSNSTLSLIKSLQQTGATPLRLLNQVELRKSIRENDVAFSTSQGVYSTWELYYFSARKT